jgi:hypothetical protein
MSGTILAAISLLVLAAPGDAPVVRYVTKVVTKSWEPLDLKEVEKMVEAKVLQPLTAGGNMRLERSGYAELKDGDFTLTIDGRFIEEAEKFSVYLTFGPGKRTELPSFHVSDTEALGGLPRATMQQKIEALASLAAKRMAEVLAPQLESARLNIAPPAIEDPTLPWDWGPIETPNVASPTKAMKDLLDVRNEDHVRWKGLEAIKGQAFDQPAVRNVLALCVLRDPLAKLRASCVEALAPVARTHVPTQRWLLHAMRTDVDDAVLQELTELSKTFVGLSRKECIETWLELIASDATPSSSASRISQVLAEEGDVPNLDFAVAKCLQQEALAYGKRQACAQWLLREIPLPRRRAVVWKYLEDVGVYGVGGDNLWKDVSENLTRGTKMDAELAEMFLRIAERRNAGHIRQDALYKAGDHPSPTPALVERAVKLIRDPLLTRSAVRAVEEMTDTNPALEGMAVGALRRMIEFAPMRGKYGGDPRKEIEDGIKTLERREQYRKKK